MVQLPAARLSEKKTTILKRRYFLIKLITIDIGIDSFIKFKIDKICV